jgi:hypothetical protein
MAKILSFEPRPPAGSRPASASGLPAIVVIFPGVRYEKATASDVGAQPRQPETDTSPAGPMQ